MYIKQDMDFNDLMENCWSGAIDTLKTVEEHDKEEELMQLLEDAFDECPDITRINDYLWFSDEDIFECLGISKLEEEEEEDILEENVIDFTQYTDFNSFCAGRDCNACPFFHYNTMENKDFDCEEYFNQKYKK